MSPVILAIFYVILAGIMNGSYALPTKYGQHWRFENIWFGYGLFAFLILPWLALLLIDPKALHIYHIIPAYTIFILLVGGITFGIGQVCFAEALKIIGFGLGFVINIGLGTGLGFLLPLVILHTNQIFTPIGLSTLAGIVFILAGLLLSWRAGQQRDRETLPATRTPSSSHYHFGVLLAVLAGFCSAGQNFTFALTNNMQQLALASGVNSLAAATIIWPLFLLCSFVPYGGYMLHLMAKNNSLRSYVSHGLLTHIIVACVMGLLWYIPLVLYSKASLIIGELGPVVIWPLFMVFIILAANFWAWRHKEWSHCRPAIKCKASVAIILLVVAVMILAYSATLS